MSRPVKQMTGSDLKSLMAFFKLLGTLKHEKRTGWVLRSVPEVESVASHMYRMSIMSMALNSCEGGAGRDNIRCMKLALVHDMAEAIVGDITPHCGVPVEEKHRREDEAMKKMAALAGGDFGCELYQLYKEYEAQTTIEAKVVKDLDRFDMVLQAFEYEEDGRCPNSLQEFFDSTQGKFEDSQVKGWVQELNQMREQAKSRRSGGVGASGSNS